MRVRAEATIDNGIPPGYSERMNVTWKDYVESDLNILRGKPRVKGTRIPVSLVLGYLAAGYESEQIITEFPDLHREQIAACLRFTI